MMVLIGLLLLFNQAAAQPGVQDLKSELQARVQALKQYVLDLEAFVQSPSFNQKEEAHEAPNDPYIAPEQDYAPKKDYPWTKEQEKNRLKEIEEELVENPLGAKQRKTLKRFVLQVQNEVVKAEALFFLGEVYYLRQKLTGGKKKDNKKALSLFSRSYSLDPHSLRTPKTLVRVAQCLAKDAKYQEAQSILQKIKAEHGRDLGFDLELEYNRVLEMCKSN